MYTYTQDHRLAAVTSPLGKDKLLFHRLRATDRLSQLFEYELDLFSEDAAIAFADIVGQPVAVRVNRHGVSDPRHFTGFVSRFVQTSRGGALPHYSATVVPWMWFLTRSADCRIFQGQTVPQVLTQVFTAHGFKAGHDFDAGHLTATYPPLEYCVQYRETDFAFVSRLMEGAGIYYYFTHADDHHTLILCDGPSAHEPTAGYESLAFRGNAEAFDDTPHLSELTAGQQVQPGQVTLTDYDFKVPRKSLQVRATPPAPPTNAHADAEVYDYPGRFTETAVGKVIAQVRVNERQAQFETFAGRTDSRAVACGTVLRVIDYPRDDRNQDYLVTAVTHEVDGDEYQGGSPGGVGGGGADAKRFAARCTFEAISHAEPYRPPRVTPKPVMHGPQTALVVGPAGQEIYVDEFGRVTVQFYWDRVHQKNENSSCRIRVAQPVAGKRWGASFWPRIGQEVVVSFLEGDPDQPLVIGSVYNGDNKPPYLGGGPDPKHAKDPNVSGFKTNSTPGGKGFSELRFDDTAGKEQVFLRSQATLDVQVLGTSNESVGGDHNTSIGWEKDGRRGGDHRQLVHQDQHLTVQRDQFEHVGGNAQLLVGKGPAGGGGNLDVSVDKHRTETIGQGSDLHVKGSRREKVDGSTSLTVGGSQQEKIGEKHAVDAGQEIHLKAGMNVTIEAGVELTIKAAGGFISIGPAGVTIQGTMVLINSGGAAGSGSGSSPAAPVDAKDAAPAAPAGADDSVTGQPCVTTSPTPTPPAKHSNSSRPPHASARQPGHSPAIPSAATTVGPAAHPGSPATPAALVAAAEPPVDCKSGWADAERGRRKGVP
ncbi:type VI secretion system Vgr family protein [Sphingomonas sp.]|uniref:type VI secretion system Vgr family protein n=1 Tax=Sphingomonas sp. TaxID=28214 RepID=UPI003B005F24